MIVELKKEFDAVATEKEKQAFNALTDDASRDTYLNTWFQIRERNKLSFMEKVKDPIGLADLGRGALVLAAATVVTLVTADLFKAGKIGIKKGYQKIKDRKAIAKK